METIRHMIQGPYEITTDLVCQGMITAGATLKAGCTFILHGMVTGDLVIEAGAKAEIYGMVNGTLRNRGADVILHGRVDELVDDDPAQPTKLGERAHVRGQSGGP